MRDAVWAQRERRQAARPTNAEVWTWGRRARERGLRWLFGPRPAPTAFGPSPRSRWRLFFDAHQALTFLFTAVLLLFLGLSVGDWIAAAWRVLTGG